METCGNCCCPVACENRGVPDPSAYGVESLWKNPSGPRVCCAMEVEVDDVPVYSIFSFFSSFLFFLSFLFFRLLQTITGDLKGNYILNTLVNTDSME